MVHPRGFHVEKIRFRGFHRASMRFFMVLPWCTYGGSMGIPWFRHVALVLLLWISVGIPRCFFLVVRPICSRGTPTVLPCGFHGGVYASITSVVLSRDFHGASMVHLWCFHGIPIVLPWGSQAASMGAGFILVRPSLGLPWCTHGMVAYTLPILPWCSHGTSMVLACDFYGASIVHLWCFYGASMGFPRLCHSASMVLSWTPVEIPWCFLLVVRPWRTSVRPSWCLHGTPTVLARCFHMT